MLKSQLMLVSPVLLFAVILLSVAVFVGVTIAVAKAVAKKLAKNKLAKNSQVENTQKTEQPELQPVEQKVETQVVQKQPKATPKARKTENKTDLIGEKSVVKKDFDNESPYNWVYKLKFKGDNDFQRTLSWKTTDHTSMVKSFAKDVKYSSMKFFEHSNSIEVDVKYKTQNGVKRFYKLYDMKESENIQTSDKNQNVEKRETVLKELCDVIIDIHQNKLETEEKVVIM